MFNVLLLPIRLLCNIMSMLCLLGSFSTARVAVMHRELFGQCLAGMIGNIVLACVFNALAHTSRQAKTDNALGRRYMFVRLLSPIAIQALRLFTGIFILVAFTVAFPVTELDNENTFLKYYNGSSSSSGYDAMITLVQPRFMYDAQIDGLAFIANELDKRGVGADVLLEDSDEHIGVIREIEDEFFESYKTPWGNAIAFIVFTVLAAFTDLIVQRYKVYNKQLIRLQERTPGVDQD